MNPPVAQGFPIRPGRYSQKPLVLSRRRSDHIRRAVLGVLAAAGTRRLVVLLSHLLQERRKSLAAMLAKYVNRRIVHRFIHKLSPQPL